MKSRDILLAKSRKTGEKPRPEETLIGHTQQVLKSAEVVLELFSQTGLPREIEENWNRFSQLVILAAGLHDLGKATNVFQGMLVADKLLRKKTHPVRHEILSALLIAHLESPLKRWLGELFDKMGKGFLWAVSWVVGGHHLKLHKEQSVFKNNETDRLVRIQGIPSEFVFWGSHPDVREVLRIAVGSAQVECSLPELSDINISVDDFDDQGPSLSQIVEEYVESSAYEASKLTKEESVVLAHAKAVLIASDVAGSALWQEVAEPHQWIRQVLSRVFSAQEIQNVIDARLNGGQLRSFQKAVESSRSSVTLTIAGCGNGKTLAAYCWAKQNAAGKKLFFSYPTTGTASAGYEDYLLAQTDLERALIHGRSTVDLERILATGDEDPCEENQRLESFKAWSQQVIVCTVDTVLGLIQNQRRALFSFPAIAGAAFVFDEIHNYDGKLFGALLTFLETFPQSPVLLMSASIPHSRLVTLQDQLGGRLSALIPGEEDIEAVERYVLKWRTNAADCWDEVTTALRDKLKVLWVCNTVPDTVRLFEEASTKNLPLQPIIYHSRFRYKDRVNRQAAVIKSFKPESPGPAFVIATQVCEMSLDISADLLASALAPFPSIIQRLGRLNRHSKRKRGNPPPPFRECLIYDFTCPNNRPYPQEDLEEARKVLPSLLEIPCSQRTLSEVLARLQQQLDFKTGSAWLDGRWETYQRPLRDSGTSLTVLMEKDLPEIFEKLKGKGLKPTSQNIAAWTVPMLYTPKVNLAQRLGGYPVVADCDIEYHEETGAQWRRQTWETI